MGVASSGRRSAVMLLGWEATTTTATTVVPVPGPGAVAAAGNTCCGSWFRFISADGAAVVHESPIRTLTGPYVQPTSQRYLIIPATRSRDHGIYI